MSDSEGHTDEMLLALLREGLNEADPPPGDVDEFARAALAWRDVDATLATMALDTISEGALEGVRATSTSRMIEFEAGQWTIDIEYDEAAHRLLGHIAPAREVNVEIHFAGNVLHTESDDMGRFDFDGVPTGPMSLVFRLQGDLEVVRTEWTVL